MPHDLNPEHRRRINEAAEDVQAAQRDVDLALKELASDSPRAQKTIISTVLRGALDKLTAARAKLEQVIAGTSP